MDVRTKEKYIKEIIKSFIFYGLILKKTNTLEYKYVDVRTKEKYIKEIIKSFIFYGG